MKNNLIDLNNHLFAQMERLGAEGIKGEELKHEIERSRSMAVLARGIIDNASLLLDAKKLSLEYKDAPMPAMLEDKHTIEGKK